MLPSREEFAALVAAYPDIPELPESVPAGHAGPMVGIKPSSIRIPSDGDRPGEWRLDTLVRWRALMVGRGHGAGRPPADTAALVDALRERVAEDAGERLTVVRVRELLGVGPWLARRVYVEYTGEEPFLGRLPGN
jgi:hypothetical protein